MSRTVEDNIKSTFHWVFAVLLFCVLQWTGATNFNWWWILLPILWPELFYFVGVVWLVGKVTNAW